MKGMFQFRNKIHYNLRQRSQFHSPSARTVSSRTESIKFLAHKIWQLIPGQLKELESIWEFKRTIKECKSCTCRLCKQYFHRICFL